MHWIEITKCYGQYRQRDERMCYQTFDLLNEWIHYTLHNKPCGDKEIPETGMLVMDYLLIRLLIGLLRTARSARALRCADPLAPKLLGQWTIFVQFARSFE